MKRIKREKLAGGMLAVILICAFMGFFYLLTLGTGAGLGTLTGVLSPESVFLALAAVICIASAVMIFALPRKK